MTVVLSGQLTGLLQTIRNASIGHILCYFHLSVPFMSHRGQCYKSVKLSTTVSNLSSISK